MCHRHGVPQSHRQKFLAKERWGRRRFRYNLGLIFAGIVAFAVQVAVVAWGISIGALPPHSDPDPDAMFFTVLLDGIGYLFMMVIANLCYFLGPSSEGMIEHWDIDRYLRVTFRLGFWFSVLLPFSIPAQLVWFCSTHPSWRQFHG